MLLLYKHECRYFVVQRVHIFVPGQKEIPKESHLFSKKFEFLNIRWRFLWIIIDLDHFLQIVQNYDVALFL